MKIKMIIIVVLLSLTVLISSADCNKVEEGAYLFNVFVTEMGMGPNKLIKDSDLIVRCRFVGKKLKTFHTKNVGDESAENERTVITYKMRLIESLKGSVGKFFTVVIALSGNSYMERGKEYVLFLEYRKNTDLYVPVSYNSGVNLVKYNKDSKKAELPDDNIDLISVITGEASEYKLLKYMIKIAEKK